MFLYINNEQVSLSLREVIKFFVDGKISQEEAAKKLDELAASETRG